MMTLLTLLAVTTDACSTYRSVASGNGNSGSRSPGDDATLRARQRMVHEQLERRGIRDAKVLDAMLRVPRHDFVPEDLRSSAYEDGALPIGLKQTISQPFIVAFMTQSLQLDGSERVLEIGTGSGYQAAILAEIADQVYTIEIIPELASQAKSILDRLNYTNIHYMTGDGYMGWPEFQPFDCIIVTAAPDHIPESLLSQLRTGGRMILPVGRGDQELILLEKRSDRITRRSTIPVRFVPMTGKAMRK